MTDPLPDPGEFALAAVGDFYAGADPAAWAQYGAFPVRVLTPHLDFAARDTAELAGMLRLLRTGLARFGVASVRCEPGLVQRPDEASAIVEMTNTRIGADGEEMGAHHSIYLLEAVDGRWRFRAFTLQDDGAGKDLREKMEQMFRERLGIGNAPGKKPPEEDAP